jgi:hypothetical protein
LIHDYGGIVVDAIAKGIAEAIFPKVGAYNKDMIEKAVKSKGYKWFDDKDMLLNIVGVRNSSVGQKVTNAFDDKLTISYKSKYHDLFFFAQNEVAKMMANLKQILTDKYFIFFWVDGIYYRKSTPKKIKNEMLEFLSGRVVKAYNFDYKFEKVPYLKYYKEGTKRLLYLTKENRHGEPEPKLYSLSRAWLKEEAVEVL